MFTAPPTKTGEYSRRLHFWNAFSLRAATGQLVLGARLPASLYSRKSMTVAYLANLSAAL